MDYQPRLITWVGPCALGFCAYAAILLTDGTEDLSWTRFAIATVVFLGVSAVGSYVLGRTGVGRRVVGQRRGPDCDRCGKPTRKPFLYNMPNYHWRCEDCERQVTDILFTAATNGTLTESMLRCTRPYPTDRDTDQ